jgi:low temperature requirement protein LtrA
MTETRRFTVPMRARKRTESHRASTPLEALFDLTFVIAVAQAARELARSVSEDRLGHAVLPYLLVFFAIWWAWVNFTWFASSYDTDDVPYRLLTLLQMSGVLVLAAGVPEAFEDSRWTVCTIGYVIMRSAMIVQWLRAGAGETDMGRRQVTRRYAVGITVVQVLWVLRLLLPEHAGLVAFLVLAAGEMAVPWLAERGGRQPTWHPHHIAERYGLFTLIVLGECISAAAVAIQTAVEAGGWSLDVVLVFAGGLLITFALWWIYYMKPNAQALEHRPDLAFRWGYSHYFIFGSIAALGAGLDVAAEALEGHIEASDGLVAFGVAVPVMVFLAVMWALHTPLGMPTTRHDSPMMAGAIAAEFVLAGLVGWAGLSLPLDLVLLAVPPAAIVLDAILTGRDPAMDHVLEQEDPPTP